MSLALSTLLGQVLNNQFRFSAETNNNILKFFSNYKPGMWIYPGVLKRNLQIEIDDAYRILSALEKLGVVESWYEYCCGNCQKVLGTVKRFNELPEYFECEVCGFEMPTVDHAIKIYRVM